MIKKKICVFAFAAWMSTLSITAYGATGWVKNGETWNYYKENGTMIKNNFTPDGYYTDRHGNYVPLDSSGYSANQERSANMFFQYLETGNPQFLTGCKYIEPGKESGSFNIKTGEKYLDYYDYQGCLNGHLFPTKRSALTKIAGQFDPGKIHPTREVTKEGAYWKAKFDPREATDEYQVPIYFQRYQGLKDYGDYKVLTGAKNAGITVYEIPSKDPEQYPDAEKFNLITQKDMYRLVHKFISDGLAGTENMSDKEVAEHLEDYLDQKIDYSDTKRAAIEEGTNKGILSYNFIYSILSGSGVCDDYSKLYRMLSDAAGLTCATEEGKTEEGIPHAWNVVRIDGTWYHVDATWADTNSAYKGLMTSCHINGDQCTYK